MELHIYSGFDELPSIDFDCLRTAVSAALSSIPQLCTQSTVLSGFRQIQWCSGQSSNKWQSRQITEWISAICAMRRWHTHCGLWRNHFAFQVTGKRPRTAIPQPNIALMNIALHRVTARKICRTNIDRNRIFAIWMNNSHHIANTCCGATRTMSTQRAPYTQNAHHSPTTLPIRRNIWNVPRTFSRFTVHLI